jgi:RNA polymerase sigma factor (sigma-70 family)
MTSDFVLQQKIKRGDSDAGGQLVRKYYTSIYQYCFLHIHEDCAEDMAQDTFVRFLEALMGGTKIEKTKSYLYRIAGNVIKNYYKKKKELLYDELPEQPEDHMPETELRLDVERALNKLPEELKETAILFFFQELKQEIAELLNIKLSLVKYRVARIKEILSKELEGRM